MVTKESSADSLWSRLSGGWAGLAAEDTSVESTPPAPPLHESVRSLFIDLARMADLQWQLMTVDVREFWNSARVWMSVAFAGGVLLFASVPLALHGLSARLAAAQGISTDSADLIVSGIAIGVALTLMAVACRKVGNASKSLQRSKEEFESNLAWMRDLLGENARNESRPRGL